MVSSSLQQFDGNPDNEGAWQAFVAANSEASAVGQQQRHSSFLYEVLLVLIALALVAGVIFGQQTVIRLGQLEAEIQTMQNSLSATQALAEGKTTSAGAATAYTQSKQLQVSETDFFRFVVAPDASAAIGPVIARIDIDYRQLCADLGLESGGEGEKLVVYVTDDGVDHKAVPYAALGVITIDKSAHRPSLAGEAYDPTQNFYRDLFDQLARRALDEALGNRKIKPKWQAVILNLYPYLTQNQLPKPVDALQRYELQKRQLAQTQSPNAAQRLYEPGSWMYPDYTLADTVADPLVEYIVVTYGRAVIPKLLDALGKYDAWDTVAPAVFAISARQFESDWHAYLQQHYPIALPESPDLSAREPSELY